MYGEPSLSEYAKMMSEANKAISTDGFKCSHNNAGWLGYYITTPKGNSYQLVRKNAFMDDGYYLCECSKKPFHTGIDLGLSFKDLEECKQYLIKNE